MRNDISALDTLEHWSLWRVLLLCVIGVAISGSILLTQEFPRVLSGPQDFYGFFWGATHAASPDLYSSTEAKTSELLITGAVSPPQTLLIYIRWPFYAALLSPLAALPYTTALIGWKALSVLGLAATTFVLDRSRKVAALALCWSTAGMVMLIWGQDTWIPLLCICLFFRTVISSRHLFAGLCIGVAIALKPHLFIPLLACSLALKHYCILLSASWVVAVALGISFVVHPNWLVEWLSLLASGWHAAAYSQMPTLLAPVAYTLVPAPWLTLPLLLLGVFCGFSAGKLLRVESAYAVSIIVGLLTVSHAYTYDLLLLLPGCLLLARKYGWSTLAACTPFLQLPLYFGIPIGTLAAVGSLVWAVVRPFTGRSATAA